MSDKAAIKQPFTSAPKVRNLFKLIREDIPTDTPHDPDQDLRPVEKVNDETHYREGQLWYFH